jgi:hypothetical protein
LQAASFGFVALGPVESDPNGLERFRVVRAAWEQMPVHMRHLIAERFAVHLARAEGLVDGLTQEDHFAEEGGPKVGGHLM